MSLANSFARSPNVGTGDERFNGRILAEFGELLVTEKICKIIAVITWDQQYTIDRGDAANSGTLDLNNKAAVGIQF